MKTESLRKRIGIDLGGTKTEVIALDENGQVLLRDRVATPSHQYKSIVQTIHTLTQRARSITGPVPHVGVGMPGALDQRTGLIKNANTTCLIGQPFAQDLQSVLGCPVVLENDANCFTLSEATDGAAAAFPVVFGVILGTGVGAGLSLNKSLQPGLHHIAGEWGHNPIPLRLPSPKLKQWGQSALWPWVDLGRPCYCNRTDCVETHLCGQGLQKTWSYLTAQQISDPFSSKVLRGGSGAQIATLAQRGDRISQQALDLYAQQLACALSVVINIVDPDAIVLGGGLSLLPDLAQSVQNALPRFVFNHEVKTVITTAKHGDSSGVRGAAWLTPV